jgi:hypothetical protein
MIVEELEESIRREKENFYSEHTYTPNTCLVTANEMRALLTSGSGDLKTPTDSTGYSIYDMEVREVTTDDIPVRVLDLIGI